jgi:uncharacterized membrane protein YadS
MLSRPARLVAAAATFLSEHYGAPVMLFALLLGVAMNFRSGEGPCAAGIEFTARQVLRIGVALLGLRITVGQIAELGWQPVAIVVLSVVLTIGLSMLAARLMGFQCQFGLLSGGATAICGASAALALAAALPAHPGKERATLFTVVGVSVLSTVSMIVYRCWRTPWAWTRASPASFSAPRSTTWRRWWGRATACRSRPATWPPSSS